MTDMVLYASSQDVTLVSPWQKNWSAQPSMLETEASP